MIHIKNSMGLTDEQIIEIISSNVYNPNPNEYEVAAQLLFEALILPEPCKAYDEDEFKRYLLQFISKHITKQK